jgi:hypothetical protein
MDLNAIGEAVVMQAVWSLAARWTVAFSLERTFASKFLLVWTLCLL